MNSEYLSSLEEFEQDASDNDECSTNKVILKVNNSFNDWISVQTVVDLYAKQNGFVANKIRKEVDSIDNSIIRRRVYTCWKSELAPKNLRFPQQILDKIEHYIRNGRLGAEQQYNLLINEFPQFNIKKKNLYNAIQKFCGVRTHDETDAATMFLYLLKQRENDPEYVIISRLEGPANELTGLFWMTSVESTQRVESINGVIKKLDRGTLLKEFYYSCKWERKHSSVPLSYITYLRTDNVYTPTIREQVSKKVKYGNAMSMAKTSVQIAVKEDVTPEFIGLLTEFIMKYHRGTGLSIENIKNDISFLGTLLQDPQRSFTENSREPLAELPEISNPEYHKTKGRPPKRLKSSIEESKNTSVGNI
ncbi:hypothetical protein RhiirC2_714941 [Rhizophagus irregularis]|uniref:Uncharacterized protein n=1 Tax=Rhizophagus irregularis TaxID=588596 RepID=A0A2N1MXJ1_9GLOM|nr:hypothetical protein RhiirC2_714941 [Rhizophagus irregularis]